MDPLTIGLGAGGALAGLLGGGGDRYSMSPEQKRYLEYLWAQLQRPESELGMSAEEKAALVKNLYDSIQQQSGQAISGGTASLTRRGMASPGQIGGMTTEIQAGAGKNYATGINDINLQSAQMGRQQKNYLLGALGGASQGNYIPENTGIFGDIGNLAQMYAYYRNRPKPQADFWQTVPQYNMHPKFQIPSLSW